jgi:ribosome biogenesis GTPase
MSTPAAGPVTGLVIAVNRQMVEVLLPDGRVERCRLHGRYRDPQRHGEGVVVGDRALLGHPPIPPSPGLPVPPRPVVGIAPRQSVLRRHLTSRLDHHAHVDLTVAANLDVCLVVASHRAPAFRPGVADRLLAVARAAGIPPLLVLNKCERIPPADIDPILAPYRAAGVEAVSVSALEGDGIPALRARLAGRLAVLLGASGVGKSALTSALSPCSAPVVGAVSEARLRAGRGRHTTVSSRLYPLPQGGFVIDTPGIRSLGLADGASAADAFPDIAALASGCRFADCTHGQEPGCAVRAALAEGRLAPQAYRGFLRVAGDLGDRPVGRGPAGPGGRTGRGARRDAGDGPQG